MRILLLLFMSSSAFSQSKQGKIDEFLKQVADRSVEFKIVVSAGEQSKVLLSNDLSIFDYQSNLSAAIDQSSPTPQFGPQQGLDLTRTATLSADYSKLHKSGWRSGLSYGLSHSHFDFTPTGTVSAFIPNLALSASTNLYKDLLSDRLDRIDQRLMQSKAVIDSQSSLEKKQILIMSLLDLSQLLETNDEISFQKRLCVEIRGQTRKLKEKRNRGTINPRDYLLSRKELNTCTSAVMSLEQLALNQESELLSKNKLESQDIPQISIETLYQQVKELYQSLKGQGGNIALDQQDQIKSLREQLKLELLREKDLITQTKPDITITIQGGLQGFDANFVDSQEDVFSATYPYVQAAVNYKLPVEDRIAINSLKANRIQQITINHRIDQLTSSKQKRVATLSETLERDIIIYDELEKNVSLSQQILTIAERDFANGLLDYTNLSEFQKGLIDSKRRLATVRAQFIVNAIEYSDFFNYFAKYY
ncbi:MAG: TolC family protein [Pseudobacteriovorax sp.]|nr:TolC family protein [Pseudobacteriovorax sp.]